MYVCPTGYPAALDVLDQSTTTSIEFRLEWEVEWIRLCGGENMQHRRSACCYTFQYGGVGYLVDYYTAATAMFTILALHNNPFRHSITDSMSKISQLQLRQA
jgi:hypothetical protein